MNLELESRDKELLDIWRDLAKNRIGPLSQKVDQNASLFDELLDVLEKSELLKPFLPAELGGEGCGLMSLALLLEEVGKTSPVVAILMAQQVIVGIRALLRVSNHPQRQEWAREAASFRMLFPIAATESAAGSDLHSIETVCSACPADSDGSFTIRGGKSYVNQAGRARAFLTMARLEGKEPPSASMFFVPRDTPGVRIGDALLTMGMAGLEAAPVEFREVMVSADALAGVHGFGYDLYNQIMHEMRIAIGAIAVGISQGAFDEAAQHTKKKKQQGKSLNTFQSLQWRFSDAAVRIDGSRMHVWRAVEQAAEKNPVYTFAAMAKIFATESACAVTDFAVQAMGSQGYLRGSLSERLFRDARFLKIGFGTSETLRNLVSTRL
ncbi:MAG: acyl-CoA/acyl-ACP dehydrogenase [Candidatus Riflebacteria bacterium]|nr:acyl-CoA/acyl-ACP dehydrogenase [Candidatus Riflebacteria bacterium]